jgi:hypothetical protein
MRKRRYEMLLPLTHNDGRPVDPEKHEKTREELATRFGALSSLPATGRGVWVHEGQCYEEEFIRLFVDVPDTRANRQFFCPTEGDPPRAYGFLIAAGSPAP